MNAASYVWTLVYFGGMVLAFIGERIVGAGTARALTGITVESREDALAAARAMLDLGARAVLLKGGHVRGSRARDVLVSRDRPRDVREWSRARIALPSIT